MNTLEDFILAGVVQTISRQFGIKTVITLRRDFTDIVRNEKIDNQDQIAFLRPKEIMLSTTGFRSRPMARGRSHGTARLNTNNNPLRGQIVGVVPITFSFEFAYFPQDINSLLRMYRKWMFSDQNSRLDFNITYMSALFSIKVELGSSLSIPEKEATYAEGPSGLEYTGDVTIHGYMSGEEPKDVYEVPLINSFEIDYTNINIEVQNG